jgi:hypothetical protein
MKTGIFKTPPKSHSCEEIHPEKKNSSGIPAGMGFWGQKKGFLKTGIGNLGCN